jgi:hypothetical protein
MEKKTADYLGVRVRMGVGVTSLLWMSIWMQHWKTERRK